MAKNNKKTITTKYGTKINVSGLSPEQTERVRKMAEDNGAYGAKGAALADKFRKRSGTNPAGGGGGGSGNEATGDSDIGINIGGGKGGGAIDEDAIWDEAPKIPGADDMQGEIDKVRDAIYGYTTQDYGNLKQQEIEAKKQELFERGIPMNAGGDDIYTRSFADIDKKYQSMEDQARNQAVIGGDASFATRVQAGATAQDSFMNAVLGMTDRELALMGLNKDFKAKMAGIKASQAGRGGGGSGGGGGGAPAEQSAIIGGVAPGFNV